LYASSRSAHQTLGDRLTLLRCLNRHETAVIVAVFVGAERDQDEVERERFDIVAVGRCREPCRVLGRVLVAGPKVPVERVDDDELDAVGYGGDVVDRALSCQETLVQPDRRVLRRATH